MQDKASKFRVNPLVKCYCRVCSTPLTLWGRWVISCSEHGQPFKPLPWPSMQSFADANTIILSIIVPKAEILSIIVPKAENMRSNHAGKKHFKIYFGSLLYIHPSPLSLSGTLALLTHACKRKIITKLLFRKRPWSSDLHLNFTSWFPLAVMLGAVWNFLAAYPLAQHLGFHFVFIAQLVGRE